MTWQSPGTWEIARGTFGSFAMKEQTMPLLDPESMESLSKLGEYSSLGIQMVACIAVFGGLGWWADRSWDTKPWLLLIGCLFGAGGGMYYFIRAVTNANRDADAK